MRSSGGAFDPETRLFYVNASNEAEWISMTRSAPQTEMTLVELGKMIYGTVCSACHGFERSINPAAPSFASLKTVKDRLAKQQALDLLETGRNQMPSFATFSDVEKRAVVAFLFEELGAERISVKDMKLSWAIVRGVSDGVLDSLPVDVDRWVNASGQARPQQIAGSICRRPWIVAAVMRLGVHSKSAMAAVAQNLSRICSSAEPNR